MDLIGVGNTAFEDDASEKDAVRAVTTELPTIFKSESDYLAAGLDFMQSVSCRKYGELSRDERTGLLRLPLTENLSNYCRHVLPYELRRQINESKELWFTTDAKTMQTETDLARNLTLISEDDGDRREAWPKVSYLWPLNPISQWITENVNATFGSQSAPVLKVANCKSPTFLIYAQAPNEHGEPLVQDWFLVESNEDGSIVKGVSSGSLETLIAPYGLDRPGFPNTAGQDEKLDDELLTKINALRLPAIEAVRPMLDTLVSEFEAKEGPRNAAILEKLETRLKNSMEQLEFVFEGYETIVKKLRQSAFERAKRNRQEAYDNFRLWAQSHRLPTSYRHCQIVAVFVGK
jgi:hypothetical protein